MRSIIFFTFCAIIALCLIFTLNAYNARVDVLYVSIGMLLGGVISIISMCFDLMPMYHNRAIKDHMYEAYNKYYAEEYGHIRKEMDMIRKSYLRLLTILIDLPNNSPEAMQQLYSLTPKDSACSTEPTTMTE